MIFNGPPTPVSMHASAKDVESPPQSPQVLPQREGIAIVGMSCRTAGGNDTPDKLWRFLMEKKHASGEVPRERWEPWLQRHPQNARIIESTSSKGYFIQDLEKFDAGFFGISPIEAEDMDPHQRLGLELSWEALENAGINPKTLAGSNTAVFMGVDSDDYSRLVLEDLPNIEAWSGIGTSFHGIPNRISYHLDLMGPSVAVDAACASSLVAIHLGRQAILSGEADVALCGGVNVLVAPALTHMLQKAGALSPDGVCLSFDDDARGYARGEGGAVIVLKQLANAMAEGDNILAVLKGTATAQDGRTNGIMAPSAKSQEIVARTALLQAGAIDPSTIGYVEAHATATQLGDPTEVDALAKVYGTGRPKGSPCYIGSIKPNVGHVEAAAGVIGFVKTVLTVNKGELAPQALLQKLNSRIPWATTGLKVVRDAMAWPVPDGPRRAACCSYGYGGSVAHAVIEQAPQSCIDLQQCFGPDMDTSEQLVPLFISSFQEKRLSKQAELLANWLEAEGRTVPLRSIASTLSQRRAANDYRAGVVASNHDEASKSLRAFSKGEIDSSIVGNRIFGNSTRKDVVFVYSGHGAQWNDMGKELLRGPLFRQSLVALRSLVQAEAGFCALEALERGEIGSSDRVQVLTYLVQIGLTEVLKSKGIEPQAIIGHSVGEIAASVAAGCLTAEEGLVIVSRRAKLYQAVTGKGGMILVNSPFSHVNAQLKGRKDIVVAVNCSPSSCVISGELAAIKDYVRESKEKNIKTFRVNTDIAFHSPMLDRLIGPLRDILDGSLHPRHPRIPIYSTSCTDPRMEPLRNVSYWISNMMNPVRFCETVEAALDDGLRIFLEIATHPIVTESINDILSYKNCDECATGGVMERGVSSRRSIVRTIAELHTLGVPIDFGTQLGTRWHPQVPGTPWVRHSYWKAIKPQSEHHPYQHDVDKHDLLGRQTRVADSTANVFTTTLDDQNKPYPLTHPLDGTEIIPAAVYCNSFRRATGATVLESLQLSTPTAITEEPREVQIIVKDHTVQLFSSVTKSQTPGGLQSWNQHCKCVWRIQDMSVYRRLLDIEAIKKTYRKAAVQNLPLEVSEKHRCFGHRIPLDGD
ncbi:unnamed protein product [Periconia digitata]|uniref:6-methylsalicylic acid synthase n=1 Tax=Periconia digitata TaxID=1303443 RepID=A0A9W4XIB7_9PLEO|nr:unnamed protein product [Periconia digitata]